MAFSRSSSTTIKRILATVVAAAVLVPAVSVIEGAMSSEAATSTITGVDVSRWDHPNGVAIDWPKVKAAGRSFAIVKATEGTTYTNPYFATDLKQARAAGLVVGSYHFARPKLPISSAADQAKFYVSTYRTAGSFRSTNTLPPVLDLEQTGGLSRADLIAWTQTFLSTIRTLSGRTPILYSYDSFIRSTMGNTTAFKNYPLWYARYTSVTPSVGMLPGGWQQWTMWQFTSTQTTPGIVGAGDVNIFNGNLTALREFADGRRSGVAPPSEPLAPQAAPGAGSASLTWSAPADDGGTAVNRYRVSIDSGRETFTPSRSFVAVGLAPGTHTYSIRAENIAGIGPSVQGSFTIAPYAPESVTAAPSKLFIIGPTTMSGASSALVQVRMRRLDTAQAIAGAAVRLKVQPERGGPTADLVLTTGPDGVATTSIRSPLDAAVTATLQGSAWYAPNVSTSQIRVKPALSANLSATSAKAGVIVRLTGGTSALLAGDTVRRQIYSGGRWVTISTGVISATGRYSFRISTATKGRKSVRVVLPETRRHLTSTSRTVVLTVR